MLKIILFRGSLIILPKNKWAIINAAVLILFPLTSIVYVDKILASIPMSGMMLDQLSLTLILLRIWLSSLILVASTGVCRAKFIPAWFIRLVIALITLLIITFSTSNMFLFYLFFEATLIPTLLLILG